MCAREVSGCLQRVHRAQGVPAGATAAWVVVVSFFSAAGGLRFGKAVASSSREPFSPACVGTARAPQVLVKWEKGKHRFKSVDELKDLQRCRRGRGRSTVPLQLAVGGSDRF